MAKRTQNEKKKRFFDRLRQTISGPGGDVGGLSHQEQGYPYITEDMITPVGKPLGMRRAVSIYSKHMLAIGYLEKSEVSDFAASLKEEIAEQGEFLKEEVRAAKEALAEAKAEAGPEIKRIKKLRAKSRDADEKADYLQELAEVEEEIASAQRDLAVAVDELSRFKKDKRRFLINYINSEVHGPDWNQGQDD
jgi:hypothetical protein